MRIAAIPTAIVLLSLNAFAGNLLTNPSFEEIGKDGVPTGWRRYGGGVPESRLSVVEDAHSGKKAVRLLDTGPKERNNKYSIGVCRTIPAEPGQIYLAEAFFKAAARNHPQAVALQITFEPVHVSKTVFATPPIGGGFRKYSIAAEAPPGTERLRLYVYTMHYWTSDTIVDDVTLRKISRDEAKNKLAFLQWGTTGLDKVRPLKRETALVENASPRAVVVPPAGGADLAKKVRDAVEKVSGVRLPVVADPKAIPPDKNIIVIGNMLNNKIAERLYWNYYSREDSLTPGPGAYVIRTVSRPYGFGKDQNIVVIGASDKPGLEKGVAAFARLLGKGPDIVLPYTLIVEPRPPLAQKYREMLTAPDGSDKAPKISFDKFCRLTHLYLKTGQETYAKVARRIILGCARRYIDQPDYMVTWPEETNSQYIGFSWDAIEECPVFSDADRLTITNCLLVCMHSLTRRVSYWGRFADNDTIIWNHSTFPLMGIYTIARYFKKHYPDLDARVDFYLGQVRGAFRGQIKSWKPQCDADSYMTLSPNHCITYTLAEGNYEYFENGNVRKFAEYLTNVCDNKGKLPGFGDSGYDTRGGYFELRGLPIAFWYYRDPRYLWRLKQVSPDWKNPYHRDIQPKPWKELVGITVIPLHRLVYDFTKTRSYYGEPITPPNVPYEQSFDKITFRENLEPDGQFLLLDGYATGKHLHYDGNSIIKVSLLGEDLLIDGDYLVRNTTEHNMVSVIKNGRADKKIPVCTALLAHADLPAAGFTKTRVKDWNGMDWTRSIFWRKGKCFAVIDEMEAKASGDFTFECVWKTPERKLDQFLDGRILKTTIEQPGGVGSRDIEVVKHPQASGGKAVRFTDKLSQLDFPLELPAGRFTVILYGYGLNSGADSFWISVDEGEKIAFHVPINKFGPSAADWQKKQPSPNVTFKKPGRHRFTVTLRENPEQMVDRIVVLDKDGKTVASVEAESPPQFLPGEVKTVPSINLYVVGDGRARAKVKTRVSNAGLHIRKLHQRVGGPMQPGQKRSFTNLLFADRSDAPLGYDLKPLGEFEALILDAGRKPVAYFGTRQTERARAVIPIEADMFWLERGRLCVVNGTKAGNYLDAEAPVSREIKLSDQDSAAVLEKLAALPAAPPAPPHAVAAEGTRKLQLLHSLTDEKKRPVTALHTPELDGKPPAELIAARETDVTCFSADGKNLWSFEAPRTVHALAAGNIRADGPQVLVGCDDEHIYILDRNGKQTGDCRVDAPLVVGTSSVRYPRIKTILVGDADRDGKPDIFVGTANANLCRYDADFNQLWRYGRVPHGTRKGMLIDLDGDGKDEVIVGNKYGSVQIFSCDGKRVSAAHSELGDVEFDIGDVDGDGKPEIINGSSTGVVTCTEFKGKKEWNFDNYGYGASAVRIADLDADGRPEVLVASETGYVYALDASGKLLRSCNLGDSQRALAVFTCKGKRFVASGGDDMRVTVLDSSLKPVAGFDATAEIIAILARELDADGSPELIAAAKDGTILILRPEP